jgi:hypothetical protein
MPFGRAAAVVAVDVLSERSGAIDGLNPDG